MTDQITETSETVESAVDHHVDAVDPALAREAVLAEAVGIIDTALGQMMQRELVSSGEVADLLLDVRMLLTAKN